MGRDLSYTFSNEKNIECDIPLLELHGFHNKVRHMSNVFSKHQLTMLIIERISQDECNEAFAFMTIMNEFQNRGYNYIYICSG